MKRRLAQLRQPPHSPPFAVWVVIGLCYYLICFVILSRLLNAAPSPLRWAAFALIVALLVGNAFWNLVFFRRKDVAASAVVAVAYAILALTGAILLTRVDAASAWVFLPYLIYLVYAGWWVFALRSLNREVNSPPARL